MKILSFDVGIIHLAFCIIEINDITNKNEFRILDWGLINLILDVIPSCHFKCSKDSNKPCDKEPKYTCNTKNGLITMCQQHSKQYEEIKKQNETVFIKIVDKKADKVKCMNEGCCKKSTYQVLNKDECYCTEHYKKMVSVFEKQIKLCEINTNCSKVSIDYLKYNMVNILDGKSHFLDVDYVVIENQPSLKNPKMKGIADNLYSYFLIRGMIDKKTITNVCFYSPSNKLKTYINESMNKDNSNAVLAKTTDDTKKYKATKNLGILYCKKLLEKFPDKIQLLETHKKKDDLCDSFLQGYNFIQNKL